MKRSTLTLTLLLPAICAAAAAAQIVPVRFSAPVSPIAGLPKYLPSPISGPLAGNGISLPSLVPALTPTLKLSAAAPLLASLPVAPALLPSRPGSLPASPADGSRDVVNNPLRRVMPGVTIRFAATAAQSASGSAPSVKATPDEAKGDLDEAFDGSEQPARRPVLRRGPISSERHISLPETDLERELGL
jgi:hypothetical protein